LGNFNLLITGHESFVSGDYTVELEYTKVR